MAIQGHYVTEKAHGGACCGITHIHSFPNSPDDVIEAFWKKLPAEIAVIRAGVPTYMPPTPYSYPEQTAKQRLIDTIRCIEHGRNGIRTRPDGSNHSEVRAGRKYGIIEVVLNGKPHQVGAWRPTLEELGFRLVSEAMNSNTMNRLYVFHRYSQEHTTTAQPDIPPLS